jgi:hypothetical protein
VQIERDIETLPPQAARQGEVVAHTGETAGSRDDDDVSQITITANNGGCGSFDHIGELGVRIPPSEGTNERRREHHVSDQPQSD